MSKITFRADEDLIERVERLDASKSEVMREALRAYLDANAPASADQGAGGRDDRAGGPHGRGGAHEGPPGAGGASEAGREEEPSLDEVVTERVDAVLEERLGAGGGRDLDLTISLEGVQGATVEADEAGRGSEAGGVEVAPGERTEAADSRTCGQCGTTLDPDHVHCPNCGEKATRRVFCDCGDEIRSDWAFCPSCGRRTPAADVLDGG